ncbi:hypothetical protein AVM15_01155 [Paraclostridium benzoelyticum]|nr:hypothetical protein AVM15_01155 [Paraclostridium benzoelyticum]
MNKKVQALAVSGVLTVGVIGGTLAWFTSQDSVKNPFNTASNGENGKGIKIVEEFIEPKNMLPGDEVNKDVQVKNTATYDQFIRVKLTPTFVDPKNGDRKKITQREVDGETYDLDTSKITLNFKNLDKHKVNETWFAGKDGYYYYIGKVAPNELTKMLLDSVTLLYNAGNEYRGIGFDIDVEAESTQASHGAYKEWTTDRELLNKFEELEKQGVVEPRDNK